MDDELMLIDETENTLPVEEIIDYQEELEEESPEISGDETIVPYEVNTEYETMVLEQMVVINDSLVKANELLTIILFFIVGAWVLKKVHRGVKEVMYSDRDN